MPDQAPRDLSGDLPSVDQYLSGLTLSDDDSVDPSDSISLDLPPIPDILHTSTIPPGTAFEDEIVDSYPTMEQLQSKHPMPFESILQVGYRFTTEIANTSVNKERIDTDISILLQRYENIMALAAVRLARQLALPCDSANVFLTVPAQHARRGRRRRLSARRRRERDRKSLPRSTKASPTLRKHSY